ncbi:BrnA antitoxin family protein [Pantoea sp. 18069]|uniref:BrnA antitoxin family protein n=1 Tax=Pantoea sp. 18069 TaxID=2681415 RepID=UPI00190F891D|nr:BrnA antitoxin family protein [Pantoea sp. 18069]
MLGPLHAGICRFFSHVELATTIRFDQDVLAALKATGKGWQTRANDLLRADIEAGRL